MYQSLISECNQINRKPFGSLKITFFQGFSCVEDVFVLNAFENAKHALPSTRKKMNAPPTLGATTLLCPWRQSRRQLQDVVIPH